MSRRPARGYVLLPVILTLAMLAIGTALLLERAGTGAGAAAARQGSVSLAYAAEAGFEHGRELLEQNGCLNASAVPETQLGDRTYSAVMTGTGETLPSQVWKLPAAADAWLEENNGDTNHGNDGVLKVNRNGDDEQAILRFDLSGVPTDTPIASAMLRLFVKETDSNTVRIRRVTDGWNESTVTWNNAASDSDLSVEHGSFVPATQSQVSIDLTPLVRQWVSGGVPNEGIMLEAGGDDSEYYSREEGNAFLRPRLDVVSRPNAWYDVSATGRDPSGIERTVVRTVVGPAASALFLDYFNAGYSGNDGTQDFAGPWQEVGESNGPGSGAIVVVSSPCAHGSCLKMDAKLLLSTLRVWRELDLGGADSATLSLHRMRSGGTYQLEVSGNGGASWHTLASAGGGSDGGWVRDVFDISPYAAENTRIRVSSASILSLGNLELYIDDVGVEVTCGP